jgi:hypothetical protein
MKTVKECKTSLENFKWVTDILARQTEPTVYGKVTHVSRSGMMRYIDFYVAEGGNIHNINGLINAATGYKSTANGVKVEGCGMDMIFAVIYDLSKVLYDGDGYKIKNRAL